MLLLVEEIQEFEYLTEDVNGKKHLYITGPFLVGDQPNKNRRVYPWTLLEEKASNYINTFVNNNRSFGELGHPKGPAINLERVSHLITELKHDGGHRFIGKARVIDEGLGKIATGIIEAGGKLGLSSRSVGTVKENSKGLMEVQKDLYISTAADLVHDPSAPGAFADSLMEQADWLFENGDWIRKPALRAKALINEAFKQKRNREQMLASIFESFLRDLSKN